MAITNELSKIVGNNVNKLRIKTSLTLEGLTFALQISISYLMMIEKGTANISAKMANRISDFFEITIEQLYSRKEIKLKSPLDVPTIKAFYEQNNNNPNFFIHRRSEYSVAYFLKSILINDNFMLIKHDSGEIRNYCLIKYKREFSSQELSRELRRLFLKKELKRCRKFDNDSVYQYWVPSKS